MKHCYQGTPYFWKAFARLPPAQQEAARKAWLIFKEDPFDPRLRPHKIHHLSAKFGRTIYAVEIQANLRATFFLRGELVISLDIGSHDIYER